jgi:hypothetical protein
MFNNILIQYWKPKGFLVNLKSHFITILLGFVMTLVFCLITMLFSTSYFSVTLLIAMNTVIILSHIILSILARAKFGDVSPKNI